MYQPTQTFIDRLNGTSRQFKARITMGNDVLREEIKSILLTEGSCGADTFTIGSVFASYADIVLSSVGISLAGREMLLEIGLLLPDNTIEYVPMGYYTVSPSEISKERDRISIKVMDRISSKCGGLYVPTVTFPATVQAVLDDIGTQAGVKIETSLPTTGTIETAMESLTYRDVLGYISGILGGFCYADRDGTIRIAAYPSIESMEVEAERFYELQTAEGTYSVDRLSVVVSEGGEDADGNQVEGVGYTSGSGNGITVSNPYMTQALFDAMKERVTGYKFYHGNAVFLGDPRLGPEDAILAINHAGDKFLLPCMSIVHDYDGGLTTTISTPGYATSDQDTKGPITEQVERLATEMVLAKEVIAKKITADEADLKFATIDKALILEADIARVSGEFAAFKAGEFEDLKANLVTTDYLNANYANLTLANIDIANINKAKIGELFADMGLITTAVIEDGHVTGYLDSVAINADNIKAGTLSVDRLIINGTTDSIVYALNNAGDLVSIHVDTLDGGILTERTITADKLVAHSITADEITASDIIGANGWINLAEATFNYGNQLIWDGENLTIAASAITMVTNSLYANQKDIDEAVDGIRIGGRNLIRNSKTMIFEKYYFGEGTQS